MTAAQIVSLLVEAALLLMAGVLGLLVRGWSTKLTELAKAVDDLRHEVAEQGRALAGGEQRFKDVERRLDNIERALDDVVKNGCARGRECLRAS